MSDNDLTRRNALYPTMTKDSGNALTGTPGTGQPEKKIGNLLMPSDRELFEEVMRPPMVEISQEIRSLAGQLLEGSPNENVRRIAGALLRCVERLETGK